MKWDRKFAGEVWVGGGGDGENDGRRAYIYDFQ